MSTSDQAKSKLLDSMRLSKQGAKEAPVAEKTAPVKKTAPIKKTAPVKKTAPIKKTAPASNAKPAKTTKKAAKPAASKETVSDSFQAARRVWPD